MIIQISFTTFARNFYGVQILIICTQFQKTTMKIIRLKSEIATEIELLKSVGKIIGLVPTMGALHDGHKVLISRCVAENDICIVSIFVNPTQFNNASDLEKYPRNLERDAELLERIGCQFIFAPQPDEIYDSNEINNQFEFNFNGLDGLMEGKFRPGHFNGVVQIVSKLFQLIQPDKAYFGEKDFQQLAIIHHLVNTMNFKVDIIDCPIVRESSGLALSSRNERLTNKQRINAIEISKVLFKSRNFTAVMSPNELVNWVVNRINAIPDMEVEYYEIVNIKTLQSINAWLESSVGCIAVFCGEVRLIDNIRY